MNSMANFEIWVVNDIAHSMVQFGGFGYCEGFAAAYRPFGHLGLLIIIPFLVTKFAIRGFLPVEHQAGDKKTLFNHIGRSRVIIVRALPTTYCFK